MNPIFSQARSCDSDYYVITTDLVIFDYYSEQKFMEMQRCEEREALNSVFRGE